VHYVLGVDKKQHPFVTYDFLLVIRINHGLISYRFRDKRRFRQKIAKFSNPRVFNASVKSVRHGILQLL